MTRDSVRADISERIDQVLVARFIRLTDEERQVLKAERQIVMTDDSHVDRVIEIAQTLDP